MSREPRTFREALTGNQAQVLSAYPPVMDMERWMRDRLGSCCSRVSFTRCVRRYDNGCAVEHAATICGIHWTIRTRIRDFKAYSMWVEVMSITRSQPPRSLAALGCCERGLPLATRVSRPVIVGSGVVIDQQDVWPCSW